MLYEKQAETSSTGTQSDGAHQRNNLLFSTLSRDEVYTAKHKAKIKSLQEEIKILEEAARKENRDRSNTLKELAVERGNSAVCVCS